MRRVLMWALIVFGPLAYGQEQNVNQKLESRKIAFLTQRLDLTPEQAERFWPIYREFSKQERELRTEFSQARRNFNPETSSDKDAQQLVELGNQIRQRQTELRSQFQDRISQVITNRQILQLQRANDEWRQLLLRRAQQIRQRQQNANQTDNETNL